MTYQPFQVDLSNCDREPIHIPGHIQPHGALAVLDRADLRVLQVSDNTLEHLGVEPRALLDGGLEMLWSADLLQTFRHLLTGRRLGSRPTFLFSVNPPEGRPMLDVTGHQQDQLVLLEFEPVGREQVAGNDLLAELQPRISRFQGAQSLKEFCDILAAEVRELTGLDRVMIYRFAADHSGWVFSEEKREDLHSYYNMHFPASDIPRPAREIFKKLWIRPLPVADYAPSKLIPEINPLTGQPLDMSYCSLRGASVMYTEYLTNMGVTGSVTMPILREGELWGLIACHHYDGSLKLPFVVRAACELIAQVASLQIRSLEQREQSDYLAELQQRHDRLVASIKENDDIQSIAAWVRADLPLLARFLDNAGFAAVVDGQVHLPDRTLPPERFLELADWLQRHSPDGLYSTEALSQEFPVAAAYTGELSGLLAISLHPRRPDFLIWHRPEHRQDRHWAGDPSKPVEGGQFGERLTPRKSFELWQETVLGISEPWLPVERESVARLQGALFDLIIRRLEKLAELNRELERINLELDTFAYVASHDLKEPLRGIYAYAYDLQESLQNDQDERVRTRLDGLKRMTERMNSLLDSLLTFSRVGRYELEREPVDLPAVVQEALDMVYALRASRNVVVTVREPWDRTIQADSIRLREILSNLFSNAIKYNRSEPVRIEVGTTVSTPPRETEPVTAIFVKDNGIGIASSFQQEVFRIFRRLHPQEDFGGGTGAGLTIVKKIVERHGGRIWLESAPDAGTTFYFSLSEPTPAEP